MSFSNSCSLTQSCDTVDPCRFELNRRHSLIASACMAMHQKADASLRPAATVNDIRDTSAPVCTM
eukprot:7662-Heterococcus_DN1.PRE.2